MEKLSTDALLKRLNALHSPSQLDAFTSETLAAAKALTFPQYIELQRQKAGMSPAQLIASAQIQRNYGYQLLNGVRKAGRDKVLAFCLAMQLPLDEVQRALTIAHESILYPKNTRDSVLIFCINQKMPVMDTNALLHERGEQPLS